MLRRVVDRYYAAYKHTKFARVFKKRRYKTIIEALEINAPAHILEVGCSRGIDFIQFATRAGFRCHGLDIRDWPRVCEFEFTLGDARSLPFPDRHFDAAVSIGLFEHIQPIEDLCRAASEIARVAKRYCVLVPSVATIFEPHVSSFLWHLRSHTSKPRADLPLLALSDEGWLQLSGFAGASTRRFWYMPGIQNLMILGAGRRPLGGS